ncbi:MAG TPA: hypothetical protein VD969_20040 [Symbiobacteriaceae bacterium]|nr:hypothetical protein [Symbiobacteriaceae bacterium]
MPVLSGPPVTVTREEYALLGGVLGATTLIGLPDPFPGMLADEIRQRLATVRADLLGRGMIRIRPDNRLLVEPRLGAIMSICAFPEVTFLLTVNRPSHSPEQYIFHVTRQGAVQTCRTNNQGLTVEMVPAEIGRLAERVQELMAFADAPDPDLPGEEVLKSALSEAWLTAAAAGAEAAGTFLAQSGLSSPLAAAVGATLANPTLNASLACLFQEGRSWKSDGFGVLAGRSGIWRLGAVVRDGSHVVSVLSSSRDAIRQETVRLIESHLPEPQASW